MIVSLHSSRETKTSIQIDTMDLCLNYTHKENKIRLDGTRFKHIAGKYIHFCKYIFGLQVIHTFSFLKQKIKIKQIVSYSHAKYKHATENG